uniref:Uncharacterized protein n=1 Tax=Cacopsylla melanoneura TaxID=428564 RepID=A0A8D8W6S6_9HEMI
MRRIVQYIIFAQPLLSLPLYKSLELCNTSYTGGRRKGVTSVVQAKILYLGEHGETCTYTWCVFYFSEMEERWVMEYPLHELICFNASLKTWCYRKMLFFFPPLSPSPSLFTHRMLGASGRLSSHF